ncbi:Serine carboxypeptidase S10 family member 2 [Bienertia sinuspersici]
MVWLTGGPGCTSLSSLFLEHIGKLRSSLFIPSILRALAFFFL